MKKPLIANDQHFDSDESHGKCAQCLKESSFSCMFCRKAIDECILFCDDCDNVFHENCFDSFYRGINQMNQICPIHNCLTCKSKSDAPLMKCLLCPAKYHQLASCVPAGCKLLSDEQMICVEHCAAIQNHCMVTLSGPNLVVPQPRIPENVYRSRKDPYQICVLFFGVYEYNWIWPKNIRPYDGYDDNTRKKYSRARLPVAVAEAKRAFRNRLDVHGLADEEPDAKKSRRDHSIKLDLKPKPYIEIKRNRIRVLKLQKLSTDHEVCQCTEDDPCSSNNRCWNWLSKFECASGHCPAKDKCQNRNFTKGSRYRTEIKATKRRGFGLFAVDLIPSHEFIYEYVGVIISQKEFNKRFHAAKNNFYFIHLDRDVYIDAGKFGNEARFINHSCEPNAQTEKWTVQGQLRIGIFAHRDIMPGEEITFQYSWGGVSTTKCRCGTSKCRGYL